MKDRKILLDVETTGFMYNKGDRIVEIACIEIFDDKNMKESFHYYINPQISIPEDSIRVHGITNDKVKNSPIFSDIVDDFLNFIKDNKIIAHNATFDMNFINSELKNSNRSEIQESRFIDTLQIAKEKFPNQRNRLDDLCKRFNINVDERKEYHGALVDTKLLGEVYRNLFVGQTNMFDKNDSYSEKTMPDNKNVYYNKSFFEYRSFNLSEAENKKHFEFIKKIKNSNWYN